MKPVALLGLLSVLAYAQSAAAQASAATQPPPPPAPSPSAPSTSSAPSTAAPPSTTPPSAAPGPSATVQPSRDAHYPKPSGQDSRPSNKPSPPKKSMASGPGKGDPEGRGPRIAAQSAPAQQAAKQPKYRGNIGKKADPGTACSTARPTANGGVDCGTGGEGATPGKVPK